MADAGEFILDAQILELCGGGASATVKGAGWFDKIIVRCEGIVNAATRFDWTTLSTANVNDTVEGILGEASGCLAAIHGVAESMAGYASRIEAEDKINVLRDRALFCIQLLRDKKVQTFIENA